jgi:hypothetical protein
MRAESTMWILGDDMDFYFVATHKSPNSPELRTIKECRPQHLLLSYFYFKNTDLEEYVRRIGYKPKILFDSGAYSAYTSGTEINLDKYIAYLKRNEKWIDRFICLDKLGDDQKSYDTYMAMRKAGLKPIPVFHYQGDERFLESYIKDGARTIALGGTVPIKSKAVVAEWVRMLAWMYPEINFHLLGSSSKKILDHCDIGSADASTWYMMSIMGKPKHIPGKDANARFKRGVHNMKKIMARYELPKENKPTLDVKI